MAGMVQEMAVYGGRGVRGGVKDMLAALKDAFGGTARGRTHMRRVKLSAIKFAPSEALKLTNIALGKKHRRYDPTFFRIRGNLTSQLRPSLCQSGFYFRAVTTRLASVLLGIL